MIQMWTGSINYHFLNSVTLFFSEQAKFSHNGRNTDKGWMFNLNEISISNNIRINRIQFVKV